MELLGVGFMSSDDIWGAGRAGRDLRKQQLFDNLRDDGLVSTPDGEGKILAYVNSTPGNPQVKVRLNDGRTRQYPVSHLTVR